MKALPSHKASTAFMWKAIQLGGVKVILMLRFLILAWLLSPEDFGLLAIAVSSIGFLLTVTDFGMIPALVQGKDVDEIRYNVAWTVSVTRALLAGGLVVLAAPPIAQIFAEPRAIPIIRVLALRPLLEALASIKVADLTRELNFRPLATLKLVEALANAIVSIALAHFIGIWALVAGVLAGATSYLLLSYLLAPHRPRLLFDHMAARSLIRFGRWIFLTSLIAMAGSYGLRVFISRQLGVAELGLYFLAAQLAFLPAEIASEVIGNVAFPLYARLQSDVRQATQVFRTLFIGMSALLFPMYALIIVLAPAFVQDVLGPRWAGTVPIIRLLALVSLIGIFGDMTRPIFKGLGQPYKITVIEIVQSLLLILLGWGLISRLGLVGAALAWLPTIMLSQLISAAFVQQILSRPLVGLGPPMLAITTVSGIGSLAALAVHNLISGLTGLVLANLLAMVIVGGLLWTLDRRLALGLMGHLGQVFPQVATLVGGFPGDSEAKV